LAEHLAGHSHILTCVDVSAKAIRLLTERFTPHDARVLDISQPLPWRGNSFDVVIADLSLHYFDEATTDAIAAEISRVLAPEGVFLARVNSIDDTAHGAGQDEEIEPGFYRHRGHYKRFFDEGAIRRFFGKFEIRSIRKAETETGAGRKRLLEVVGRNITADPG
jgi:SAM-dependent methyltransferase